MKANRAAQFNPFDALKGLQEALREREEKLSRVEKKEVSEEQQDELSNTLGRLERGLAVSVTFYNGGHYIQMEGTVTDLNFAYRVVVINSIKLYFDDIYELRIL